MRSGDAPPMPEQLRLTVRPIGRKDPIALFRRVQHGRWPFFLDSSLPEPELARYSFLGSDPVGWFRSRGPRAAYATPWGERSTDRNPLDALERFIESLPRATAGKPSYPFLGGPVGYFGYDLGRLIEHVPDEKPADLQIPDIHLAVYPRVYIIDRLWGETFVVAPRTRIEYEPPPIPDDLAVPPDPRPIDPLASEDYVHTIEEAKRAIVEGEIFQVNLSHRVALPLRGTPAAAYERLRTRTHGPLERSSRRATTACCRRAPNGSSESAAPRSRPVRSRARGPAVKRRSRTNASPANPSRARRTPPRT